MSESRAAELAARFGTDPDALEWARGEVRHVVEQLDKWEAEARANGENITEAKCRWASYILRTKLIGGRGCVITSFDHRRPRLKDVLS